MWLTVGVIVLVALLVTIAIFGDSPLFRGTLVHRSKTYIFHTWHSLSHGFHQVNNQYFNGRLEKYLGWLVPSFYIVVVTFCIFHFFKSTYPILPFANSYFHNFFIGASIILIYVFTYLATFSDPGIITTQSVSKSIIFFINQLIFFDGRTCSTCLLEKPARSKHCSVCGHCIMLFDHHCIWVNNCIGYYNYRWFVGYLIANINFLIYGGFLNIWTLQAHKQAHQGYWKLIKSSEDMKITGIFAILCTIFTIITSAFTALHIRYIYLGVTTNEYEKWAEIEHLIGLGALYKCENFDQPYVEQAVVLSNDAYETVYISLDDAKILFKDSDKVSRQPVTSMERDLVNVYDSGFWNNLKQRLLLEDT